MAYKTNLIKNKREQLKAQMDDFATFQWRGHDMFEDFGCFIINDKNGSLKFYNGPGFSNQYAKPQFSSSVSGLLGIDFKQQTIPMKVGLYWFTIEEYEKFLHEIGPDQINYLTFNFAKDYGYLVKLGKISDSPRHILGRDETGEYRYYTELDLTWELLGDNCVRSNLPYEYKRKSGETSSTNYTWVFDSVYSDMKDNSKLDTPLFFEIPLSFSDSSATLSLSAINETEVKLFDIELQNLTINNSWKPGPYKINYTANGFPTLISTPLESVWVEETSVDTRLITVNELPNILPYDISATARYDSVKQCGDVTLEINPNYMIISAQITSGGDTLINQTINSNYDTVVFSFGSNSDSEFEEIQFEVELIIGINRRTVGENHSLQPLFLPIRYNDKNYHYVFFEVDYNENRGDNQIILIQELNKIETIQKISTTEYVWTWGQPQVSAQNFLSYVKNTEVDKTQLSGEDYWAQYYNVYQMFLRYDSETGLIYIQEGSNNSWHLLNYQTNLTGNYILKSAQVSKFLLPGKLNNPQLNSTEWSFKLKTTGVDLSTGPIDAYNSALTIYARKKIV